MKTLTDHADAMAEASRDYLRDSSAFNCKRMQSELDAYTTYRAAGRHAGGDG